MCAYRYRNWFLQCACSQPMLNYGPHAADPPSPPASRPGTLHSVHFPTPSHSIPSSFFIVKFVFSALHLLFFALWLSILALHPPSYCPSALSYSPSSHLETSIPSTQGEHHTTFHSWDIELHQLLILSIRWFGPTHRYRVNIKCRRLIWETRIH